MIKDLKSMSHKELLRHRKAVEKALVVALERDRHEAKKAAEKAAAQFGFTLSQLNGGVSSSNEKTNVFKLKTGKKKKTTMKGKAMYANPADPRQTWTGKGRRPIGSW